MSQIIDNISRMTSIEQIMYLADGSRKTAIALAEAALVDAINESHKLRESVEWAQRYFGEADASMLELLASAERDADRLAALLDQLTEVSA